jgi:hypothetical protein
VDGNITSPRVAIAEGAHFKGSIDMQKPGGPAKAAAPEPKTEAKPPSPVGAGAPAVKG